MTILPPQTVACRYPNSFAGSWEEACNSSKAALLKFNEGSKVILLSNQEAEDLRSIGTDICYWDFAWNGYAECWAYLVVDECDDDEEEG